MVSVGEGGGSHERNRLRSAVTEGEMSGLCSAVSAAEGPARRCSRDDDDGRRVCVEIGPDGSRALSLAEPVGHGYDDTGLTGLDDLGRLASRMPRRGASRSARPRPGQRRSPHE